MALLEPVRKYAEERIAEFDQIPQERRARLDDLANFIRLRRKSGEPIPLIFICTQNSRRSHLAQVWASAAADHYNVSSVLTYSGGTVATAFHPRAVNALRKIGFKIEGNEKPANPRYRVKFATTRQPLIAWSKRFDDSDNPRRDFGAVMVCSDADAACPVVSGAVARFSLPFEDPKKFDDTEQADSAYEDRTRQVAREMLYIFSRASGG